MAEEELCYFAYGSNLDPKQLRERIGEWQVSIKHVLPGYRLVFNVKSRRWGGFTANILATSDPQDKVYGAKYRITGQQLEELTQSERVEPTYLPEIESYANIFPTSRPGMKPPSDYLDTIIRGLIFHGYGDEVVAEVRRIANV